MLKAFNVGTLLAVSSAVVALSGYGYAAAPIWMLFAACSVLHGLGPGAIDAGLNHYVAHHLSARHMNWLHACYSVGAMLGPLIMTGLIAWNGAWRSGYLFCGDSAAGVGAILCRDAASVGRSGTFNPVAPGVPAGPALPGIEVRDALRHSLVWLHIVLFFIYTGLEITIGQWSFTILTDARGLSKQLAGFG